MNQKYQKIVTVLSNETTRPLWWRNMATQASAYIGEQNSYPQPLTALQLIDRSRQGLMGTEAGRIAGLLGVTDKEMARLLNQSVATFHRQVKVGRLDASTSEKILLLGRLAGYGATVFQDQGKFNRWLRRPLRLLGDRSPLDLLDSPTGVQLIEDILGRIEYGVVS